MKVFRMMRRSIRDAFKSVFRNFSLSLASVFCITITLIVVAFSIVATYNVNNFTNLIEKDVTVVAFLEAETDEEGVEQVKQTLEGMANVDSIEFKSKEDAKNEMMAEDSFFEETMGGWSEEDNPLKDSYMIKVKDIDQIGNTVEEIKNIEHVSIVEYGEGTVEKLVSAFDAIRKVSIGVVIALLVVTVFLIVNTIKLTIFSRKREISIMRLVGASNFSIKHPFVIEGMILGVIGSIIPILFTTYGYIAFYNHMQGILFSPIIKLIQPEPFIYIVSGIILLIGVVVGMIGSYRAVQKYLKV